MVGGFGFEGDDANTGPEEQVARDDGRGRDRAKGRECHRVRLPSNGTPVLGELAQRRNGL